MKQKQLPPKFIGTTWTIEPALDRRSVSITDAVSASTAVYNVKRKGFFKCVVTHASGPGVPNYVKQAAGRYTLGLESAKDTLGTQLDVMA